MQGNRHLRESVLRVYVSGEMIPRSQRTIVNCRINEKFSWYQGYVDKAN